MMALNVTYAMFRFLIEAACKYSDFAADQDSHQGMHGSTAHSEHVMLLCMLLVGKTLFSFSKRMFATSLL